VSPKKDDQGDDVTNAVLQLLTTGAGSAGALAVLGTGAAGTIVGAVAPAALALSVKLGQRAAEWCRLREGRVVELAAASMGGLDIFENRLQDPERLELYSRVIKAAGRSTFEAKLRALAKVLADGVMDGGSVYEAMVLVPVIEDLEAPHVLLLRHLDATPMPAEEFRRPSCQGQEPEGWELHDLEQAVPVSAGVIGTLVAVLVRHGLIRDAGGGTWNSLGPAVYQIAPLGERCLLLLGAGDL
jgi:hypothetical protein